MKTKNGYNLLERCDSLTLAGMSQSEIDFSVAFVEFRQDQRDRWGQRENDKQKKK